ncbi:hypothetical protein BJX64DRAFT_249203, partial [Aspergillus heterothallicus]
LFICFQRTGCGFVVWALYFSLGCVGVDVGGIQGCLRLFFGDALLKGVVEGYYAGQRRRRPLFR